MMREGLFVLAALVFVMFGCAPCHTTPKPAVEQLMPVPDNIGEAEYAAETCAEHKIKITA